MPVDDSTDAIGSTDGAGESLRKGWLPAEAAVILWHAEQAKRSGMSERDFARSVGVARSTLRYWKARKDGLDSDPGLVGVLRESGWFGLPAPLGDKGRP